MGNRHSSQLSVTRRVTYADNLWTKGVQDGPHPQYPLPNSHNEYFSQPSSYSAAEVSPQWNRSLPHSRCSCRLSTAFLSPRLRAQDALPHHPATLRHLSWKTHPGNTLRARSETAHANCIPSTYPGSGGYDPRGQGARRGAKRPFQRSTNGWATESRAQGSAWVYCRWVQGRGWRDIVGRSVPRG